MWLLKKSFIGLLTLSGCLATKLMSLNNEQCKTRLTFIDLNPVEIKFYSSLISLISCNSANHLSAKIKQIKQNV